MKYLSTLLLLFIVHSATAQTLIISTISNNPTRVQKQFRPLALYLSEQLKNTEYDKVEVLSLDSTSKMISALKKGAVDLYFDSPFIALDIASKSSSEIFLLQRKNNQTDYRSIIFSRKDKNISSLTDLINKTIVFKQDYSTSSYLLPKAALEKKGYNLVKYNKKSLAIKNKINYVFSKSDQNTMFWILRNKHDAGSMSLNKFKKLAGKHRNKLNILFKTITVPRYVVSHRENFSPLAIEKIKQILIAMNKNPDGKKALHALEKTARFEEFPGGVDNYLKPLKRLVVNPGKKQ